MIEISGKILILEDSIKALKKKKKKKKSRLSLPQCFITTLDIKIFLILLIHTLLGFLFGLVSLFLMACQLFRLFNAKAILLEEQ